MPLSITSCRTSIKCPPWVKARDAETNETQSVSSKGSVGAGRLGSSYERTPGSPGKEERVGLGPSPWRENMAKLTTGFLGLWGLTLLTDWVPPIDSINKG